ncbi:MAG: RloB family protein [Myxococcota bacterium]
MAARRRDRSKPRVHGRPAREPRRRILLVCEGLRTEPEYFRGYIAHLRASTVRLEIVAGAGDPKNIVDAARLMQRSAAAEAKRHGDAYLAYNEVWCVFDRDQHVRFDEAIALAQKHRVRVAPSNPCFELWLCLHFRDNPGARTPSALAKLVRKHCSSAEKRVTFSDYASGVDAAVERAAAMDRTAEEAGEPGRNPTTAVHRLIEAIRQR